MGQPDNKGFSKYLNLIINLLVVYSLLALNYNIYSNFDIVFEVITIGYTTLLTIAIILSLLSVSLIALYLYGLAILYKEVIEARDIFVANNSQGIKDYDIEKLKESTLKYEPNNNHLKNINFVYNKFNNINYMIGNYIFTTIICFLAFQLAMYYLFIMEIASLIFIEIMKLQTTKVHKRINSILTTQQELKEM